MSMGGKKSSLKCPRSVSFHANPACCSIIKWCINLRSSGNRNPTWFFSMISIRSLVYLPVGLNSGGSGDNVGIIAKGSPRMFRTILNFPGSSARTGLVFLATGLYFLPVLVFFDAMGRWDVLSRTSASVDVDVSTAVAAESTSDAVEGLCDDMDGLAGTAVAVDADVNTVTSGLGRRAEGLTGAFNGATSLWFVTEGRTGSSDNATQ